MPPRKADYRIEAMSGLVPAEERALLEEGFYADCRHAFHSPERLERISLSESDLWKPLVEEVLLKGWCPAGVISDPQDRPTTRPLPDASTGVEPEYYLLQAVVLSGKMKLAGTEERLLNFLQAEKSSVDLRAAAAVALGRLAADGALPVLMEFASLKYVKSHPDEFAQDHESTRLVCGAALDGIALGGFDSAIPQLEHLLTDAEAVEKRVNFDWGFMVRNTLHRLVTSYSDSWPAPSAGR